MDEIFEFTEKEKRVLVVLFKMFVNVVENMDLYVECENFDRNDLYNLTCKLGIDSDVY